MKKFNALEETACLTLYCRYLESIKKKGIFKDSFAQWYIEKNGVPHFNSLISKKVIQGVCIRTYWIDRLIKEESQKYDNKINIVSVACGLDSRWNRLSDIIGTSSFNSNIPYYEIDSSNMLILKKEIIKDSPFHKNYKQVVQIHADLKYGFPVINTLNTNPTLIIIEGLMMYLSETYIIQLLNSIKNNIARPIIILDTYSEKVLRISNKNNQKSTGNKDLRFNWAPDNILSFYQDHAWEVMFNTSIIKEIINRYRPWLRILPIPSSITNGYQLLKLYNAQGS